MADKDPLILDFTNGSVPEGVDLGEYYVSGLDDEPTDWDGIDLEEMFDLPPVLPPVRLPDETELAAQARRSALLADLRALADEVRTTTVQAAAVNPVFLRLAEEAELVESDGEDLTPGEDAEWLDDLTDGSDALDAWEYTFAAVLDTTLEAADDSDPVVAHDLDLEGHGPALVMMLFLSRRDGVSITELGDAIKDAATAGQATEEAGRQWQEWVDAHGDPLRLLLGQLERLGAVSVTDDVARLEPLGMQAVCSKLERDDLFVPVLPAPDKMTPDDLVLVYMHGSDDDLEAELASWTAARGEEQAARELLAFAADGNAATRTAAVTIVSRLGQGAGSAWREALARAELRCYAKPQLAQLAGLDPEGTDLPAELQLERADAAWLIADTFGPISHFDLGREKFPFDFAELQRVSGFEKPDEVFEAVARLDHPDAGAVLAMIGKHASDKTTAKAARRAAYKASIRRPALAPRRSPGWSLIAPPAMMNVIFSSGLDVVPTRSTDGLGLHPRRLRPRRREPRSVRRKRAFAISSGCTSRVLAETVSSPAAWAAASSSVCALSRMRSPRSSGTVATRSWCQPSLSHGTPWAQQTPSPRQSQVQQAR